MNPHFTRWAGAAAAAFAALAFSSCAYDPYYTTTAVGGSYSSGYGEGYGYGGSSFSTSVFVSTGDPRWGYDPYCYSYYDYNRRCYYDPYLNGYYPIGYRPPVVYGVPHPYGWRPGHGYCPPPRNYYNRQVSNYRNRENAYRSSNYGWASQVRQQSPSSGRTSGGRPQQGNRPTNYRETSRPNNGSRPTGNNYGSRPDNGTSYGGRSDNGTRPQQRGNSYPRPTGESRTQENPYSYSRPGNGSRPEGGTRPTQGPNPNSQRPSPSSGGSRYQPNNSGIPSRYNTPVRASDGPSRQRVEGNRQQQQQGPRGGGDSGRGQSKAENRPSKNADQERGGR